MIGTSEQSCWLAEAWKLCVSVLSRDVSVTVSGTVPYAVTFHSPYRTRLQQRPAACVRRLRSTSLTCPAPRLCLCKILLLYRCYSCSAQSVAECDSSQGQLKPRAVLVELMSVGAKHTAFQASSRLRAARIRLDEDLTPQQMQQRKGLSTDFQCLKARGYKPSSGGRP